MLKLMISAEAGREIWRGHTDELATCSRHIL